MFYSCQGVKVSYLSSCNTGIKVGFLYETLNIQNRTGLIKSNICRFYIHILNFPVVGAASCPSWTIGSHPGSLSSPPVVVCLVWLGSLRTTQTLNVSEIHCSKSNLHARCISLTGTDGFSCCTCMHHHCVSFLF